MKYRAPAGGMISGNQFYPGGKLLPLEATGQVPHKMAADEAPTRTNPLEGRSFIFVGMKPRPAGDSVKKFDAKNETDVPEGPSENVTGYGFSSPNTKPMGSLQFPEAHNSLSGKEQRSHVNDIEYTLATHGVHPNRYKVYNAVGDWGQEGSDPGAENSAVHVIKEPIEWNTLRKTAAQIGHLKRQLSVLVFQPKADGDSLLHRLYIPNRFTMEQIRDKLKEAGVYHRTVVPAPEGAHVVFVVETPRFGVDPQTTEKLNFVAKEMGDHRVDRTKGQSSWVGEEGNKPVDGNPVEWTYERHSKPEYERIMGER